MLRSALVVVLLLAAAADAAAQWSDVIYSWWSQVNVTRLCALDAPATCVYFPRIWINATDFSRTWIYMGDNVNMRLTRYLPNNLALLQFVVRSTPPQAVDVFVPAAGYIFASSVFAVNGKIADSVNICDRSGRGVYVPAGVHRVAASGGVPLPLFYVDRNCVFYRLGDYVSHVPNATTLNRTIVSVFYMPTARERRTIQLLSFLYDIFNGTAHVYVVAAQHPIDRDIYIAPVGRGFYIANGTAVDAAVFVETAGHRSFWYLYGPIAFDLWRNATFNTGGNGEFRFYSIGPAPGDGIVHIALPDYRSASVVYLSDGTAGYMRIERHPPGWHFTSTLKFYAERYAIVEVAVSTADGRVFGTRTLACPAYNPTPLRTIRPIYIGNLTRLDRAKEVEICNRNNNTVYVGLYLTASRPLTYAYIDVINPGECRRFRWDGVLPNTATELHVFGSALAACANQPMLIIPGRNYADGWRYLLVGRHLVPDGPIDPDAYYAELWRQIIQTMMQMYRNMTDAFLRWLANASASNATSLQSLVSSRPQFLGTIRMDSATSTWLRTTLNELQRWRATGADPSFAGPRTPQVPVVIAPAAAAAVAVAWAASRRDDDVATTAAIAGIALALFGILMTLIFSTESLTLVALGVIVAAAAAAWRRIT
jgi:hypothetical protein